MNARTRRRIAVKCLIVWLTVGSSLTWIFKDAIWWVQVQSYVSILLALVIWWAAETPVEVEDDK